MKIVNSKYNLNIEMKEGITDVIIIENPKFFYDIVNNIYIQQSGEEGDFVLSDANKEISISKSLDIIINPFSMDFNEKRIQSKLYQQLFEVAVEKTKEKSDINYIAVKIIEDITSNVGYSGITYNMDFEWKSLFKLYDVKIDSKYERLIEKLIEYIKVLTCLCKVKVLCIVNIKSMLTEYEILELYHVASVFKIQLILIESCEKIKMLNEHIHIIDNDMCLVEKM